MTFPSIVARKDGGEPILVANMDHRYLMRCSNSLSRQPLCYGIACSLSGRTALQARHLRRALSHIVSKQDHRYGWTTSGCYFQNYCL